MSKMTIILIYVIALLPKKHPLYQGSLLTTSESNTSKLKTNSNIINYPTIVTENISASMTAGTIASVCGAKVAISF